MSEVHHGLVVLSSQIPGATRDALVQAADGTLIDETEASLTFLYDDKKKAAAALKRLVKLGAQVGATAFEVEATVPDWLPQYREAAASLVEHGG